MIDRYTKIVLTVIAVALSALALQGFTPRAIAAGPGCGDRLDPCYVQGGGRISNDEVRARERDPIERLNYRDADPIDVRVVGR